MQRDLGILFLQLFLQLGEKREMGEIKQVM